MQIFDAFILNSDPGLYKPEYQLCLILLDMYINTNDGVFPIEELHRHPLMNKSLKSQLYPLCDKLSGAKVMMKYQWPHTAPTPDYEIKNQPPEFVLFYKIEIDKTEIRYGISEYTWSFLNRFQRFEFDPNKFHEIRKYNMIRLYFWFKTWEKYKFTKCNIDWLKMYLDINVKTRSLNDKYIKEFISLMEKQKMPITVQNIRDIKWNSTITYLLVSTKKEEPPKTPEQNNDYRPNKRGNTRWRTTI